MPSRNDIMWRVAMVYVFMLVFGITIVARILWIQFAEGDNLRKQANVLMWQEINPNRGDIYDANGRILCSSIPYYEIRMDTKARGLTNELFNSNIDSLALCLSEIFEDKTRHQYKKSIVRARNKGNRYLLIKRRIDYTQLKQLRTFPLFRLSQNKGGLIVEQQFIRVMPHENLAQRTIGYLSKDMNVNKVGIEGAFDFYLKGSGGKRLMYKVPGSPPLPLNTDENIEPKDGIDVITTIDVNIQDVATSALYNQLKTHEADHGTVILMEVKTGYIKAIANLERMKDGNYKETYNYALGETTEPGSTFKLPVLMAALEDGLVEPNDTIDTEKGIMTIYNKKIRDSHEGGYGRISVKQVLELSSNVGMAKIITTKYSGKEKEFVDRLYSMGLGKKLDISISGEGNPLIRYPDDKYWSGLSLAQMAYGYEVLTTPLQLLAFYNAVANDGKMLRPLFVQELRQNGITIKHYAPEVINPSICSSQTLKEAKEMLEGVVEHGTATNLRNECFKIAGKTGTAQIVHKKGGYKNDTGHVSHKASFIGYFPADKPLYSCIVLVHAPSKNVYYGNVVAGPVFLELAKKIYAKDFEIQQEFNNEEIATAEDLPGVKGGKHNDLKMLFKELNIPYEFATPGAKWEVPATKSDKLLCENLARMENIVPNVINMGLKDAVFLLEELGLDVEIRGRGNIKRQSIPAGTEVKKGDKIILELTI